MNSVLPLSVKGVIFDYGATIDSNGKHWAEVIREGYEAFPFSVPNEDFRKAYVYAERALAMHPHILPHHNFLDLMRIKMKLQLEYLEENGMKGQIPEGAGEFIARYCYDYASRCVSQAKPLLEKLASRYPMVLVSNFYGNIETVLADFGLRELFPQIVESAVVGVRKPDPAIFALGVDRLQLPCREVVVVGDSYTKDIAPALSLGCQAIWLKGKGWDEKESEIAHDAVITDFQQLSDYLL